MNIDVDRQIRIMARTGCFYLHDLCLNFTKGVARGGSWSARDPPFVSLFLSK